MSGKKTSVSCNLGCGGSFLGIASLGVGAYHGYMDAQGIPLPKENLEWVLTWGPTVVQGGIGAIFGGVTGLIGGGVVAPDPYDSTSLKLAKGAAGAALGTVAGAGIGGLKGGLETLVGYGIGYVIGSLAK